MRNKSRTIITSILFVIFAVMLSLIMQSATIGVDAAQVTVEDTGIKEVYSKGESLEIKPAKLVVGSVEKNVQPILLLPDGKAVKDTNIVLNVVGAYRLKYIMENEGKTYIAEKQFVVYDKIASFTNEKDSAEFDYSELYNKEGLIASLSRESVFKLNKPINLYGKTKNQPFISLNVLPNNLWQADALVFYIVLTDIYNPLNTVTVSVRKSPDPGEHNEHVVYVTAGATGQHLTGWVKGIGDVNSGDYTLLQTTNYGTGTAFSMSGGLTEKTNNDLQIAMDWRTKAIYLITPNNSVAPTNALVIDLDDDFTNAWEGFTTGEVFLSIYADKYNSMDASQKFNLLITDIIGVNLTEERFNPENNIKANIDFEEYTESDYPMALVGKPYRVFDADYKSIYGYEQYSVRAFYGYNSSFKYEVDINDGVFIPKDEGYYTIEYRVTDRYGKPSVTLLDIKTLAQLDDMEINLEDIESVSKTGICGHTIDIVSDISVTNALGKIKTLILAKHAASGSTIEVKDNAFIPNKEGEWTVEYTLTDYVERQKQITYTINVERGTKPVFPEQPVMPAFFIKGAKNTLPQVTAVDYTSGVLTETDVTVTANMGGPDIPIQDYTFIPSGTGNVNITYKATSSLNEDKIESFNVTVLDVGFANNLNLSKYFYTEDAIVGTKEENFVSYSTTGNSDMKFIRPLIADNLNFTFNIGAANAAERINIVLTDVNNSDETIKISLHNETYGASISINDGRRSTLAEGLVFGGGLVDYSVNLKKNTLNVTNNSLTVEKYANGSAFAGFSSKFVYMTVEFEYGLRTGQTLFYVKNINGQPFGKTLLDEIPPMVLFETEFFGQYLPGQKVTISSALVSDVLDPFSVIGVSVLMPDNKAAVSDDGITLTGASCERNYTITLNQIGNYRVTYISEDGSGNISRKVFSVNSMDIIPPEITLSLPDKTVNVGEAVQLPEAMITDNHVKTPIICSVFVKEPVGRITSVIGTSFTPSEKGIYVFSYVAFDKYNNMTIKEFKLTVR